MPGNTPTRSSEDSGFDDDYDDDEDDKHCGMGCRLADVDVLLAVSMSDDPGSLEAH
jgi:hypothetical protein